MAGPRARAQETGFLDRTVTVGGTRHRHQLFLPRDYDPATRWPVVLFLHGSGERGSDGVLQTHIGLGAAIRQHVDRVPAIVLFPQLPRDWTWRGRGAALALAALDAALKELAADEERVALTGISLGGNGAWYLAFRHAERFAALAPICGWVDDATTGGPRPDPVVPEGSGDVYAALAGRLRRTPTWIVHGEVDRTVPPTDSRAMAEALHRVGAPARYTELMGVGHVSWDAAYGSPSFWTWLLAQRRAARAPPP